jgi:hypothetical protein
MSLTPCRDCGERISVSAASCPHCGSTANAKRMGELHDRIAAMDAAFEVKRARCEAANICYNCEGSGKCPHCVNGKLNPTAFWNPILNFLGLGTCRMCGGNARCNLCRGGGKYSG